MVVAINKEALTVEQRAYPMRDKLAELVVEVAKINPLFDFVCDPHCVTKDWNREKDNGNGGKGAYEHYIYKVKVVHDGEELGAVTTSTRYRAPVGCESVYGIESFRISKERGRQDTSYTKDLKVALRLAKKTLVARATDELQQHIYSNVSNFLRSLDQSARNGVRYSIDLGDEALIYAQAAYLAHKEGKTTVELPVKLKSVRDYDEYLRRCSEMDVVGKLWKAFQNKEGYAIKTLEDGKIVCVDLGSVSLTKYADIESMPSDLASKFVMFNVLSENEVFDHIGVKLSPIFYYVVK